MENKKQVANDTVVEERHQLYVDQKPGVFFN